MTEEVKTTGLTIIEAAQAVKDGKRVRRKGWGFSLTEGNGCFCFPAMSPYTVYLRDILSENWEIVSDPPETMSFQKAVELMNVGHSVRLLTWPNADYYIFKDAEDRVRSNYSESCVFKIHEILSDQWVLADQWVSVAEEGEQT